MKNDYHHCMYVLVVVLVGSLSVFGGCGGESGQASRGDRATIRYPGYQQDDLWRAVRDGKPERVARLVKDGADVNARNSDGESALALAVRTNRRNIVRLLLDRSEATVDLADDEGITPLMLAVAADPFELDKLARAKTDGSIFIASPSFLANDRDRRPTATAEELLRAGADTSARDKHGRSPIMYAKTEEKIRLLVAAGADPNAEDKEANTPLMNALSECNSEALRTLLELGTRANEPNTEGVTAYQLFTKISQQDLADSTKEYHPLESSEDSDKRSDAQRRLECFDHLRIGEILRDST